MATCSQCGTAVTEGATFCPVCGTPTAAAEAPAAEAAAETPQGGGFGATAAPPGSGFGTPSAPPGSGFGTQAGGGAGPFQISTSNLNTFDWITVGATLLLFISLFLPWYSISGDGLTFSNNAVDHAYMYIALILCLALIAYFVAKLGWGKLPFQLPVTEAQVVLGVCGLNLLLVIIAFINKSVSACVLGSCASTSSGVGWSIGAFIGLIAALAALAPSLPPVQKKLNEVLKK